MNPESKHNLCAKRTHKTAITSAARVQREAPPSRISSACKTNPRAETGAARNISPKRSNASRKRRLARKLAVSNARCKPKGSARLRLATQLHIAGTITARAMLPIRHSESVRQACTLGRMRRVRMLAKRASLNTTTALFNIATGAAPSTVVKRRRPARSRLPWWALWSPSRSLSLA